jgi:phage shock protein C
MKTVETAVFAREDTMFGVCQALGEDFGFSPTLLRLALAGLLFFNPLAAVAAYAGAGVLVALTRWVVPNPAMPEAPSVGVEPATVHEEHQEALPLAA